MSAVSNSRFGVVLVTAASEGEAQKMARSLVESRLAACVSYFPVRSHYRWQGEICEEGEWQLLIKTDLSLFPALEAHVKALHSYEVPELIALPVVAGSESYLGWLGEMMEPLS
ncbi:MAG: divalent-cation tolerance protein CutA [Chloroflexaceae bacterium]|nr:divalent-cation tolerance protein CutA [Chloroflexaceae bacterium]